MKKLSFSLLLLLSAVLIFTSCKKDEEEQNPPKIVFHGGIYEPWNIDYVDGDVTLAAGEAFVFGFTATSQSDKNLSKIEVERNYENVSILTVLDSTVSVSTYSVDITTVAYTGTPGNEVFTIKATDKNGLSTSISFTVTSEPADPGIESFTDISLGSFQSSTNSSFASITGETFSLAQASDTTVQKKIDWVYFHGSSYGHTLMSASNETLWTIYPAIENWDFQNTSLFNKTSLDADDFGNVQDIVQLTVIISTSGGTGTLDYASELQPNNNGFATGDVFAFETENGKIGLILIKEVNPGATNGESTIKYDIKVEK